MKEKCVCLAQNLFLSPCSMSVWVNVFSQTLLLLLLCTHVYSGALQHGGANWTPDEIGSGSYTDRLVKAKPAWPLNKHLRPLFGLWAPSCKSTVGRQTMQAHFPTSASHRLPLHSTAQLRRRMPRQVKPLTWVWVRTSPVESVFMHRHALQPNGQPLFLFPPARMRTQRNRYTHSRGPNVDERCCCQCADEQTHKNTVSSLKFSGLCTSSAELGLC